jgi:hypothetical protein
VRAFTSKFDVVLAGKARFTPEKQHGYDLFRFIAPPMDAPTLSGDPIAAGQVDLTARYLVPGG